MWPTVSLDWEIDNMTYEHFNAMGKFFHSAFQSWVLILFCLWDFDIGDDDADLEGADFEAWKDQLLVDMKENYCKDAFLPP